jgi:acylpyruvate hydrolase
MFPIPRPNRWFPLTATTFHGIRPFIEKSKLPSIDQIGLWLKVNGETKQDGMCSDMIFKVPKLIEHVSSIMTLSVSSPPAYLGNNLTALGWL